MDFGVPDPSLYSIYTDKKYYTRGLLKKRCSLDLLKANQHIVEKTMPNSVMNNVFCVVQNHEPPRHPIPGNAQALYIYPGTPLNGHPPNLLCTNYEKKNRCCETLCEQNSLVNKKKWKCCFNLKKKIRTWINPWCRKKYFIVKKEKFT